MAEVNNLAEALATDLADVGLAELESPGVLRSLTDDTRVALEQDEDSIRVYENGDEIADISTDDDEFSGKLMATVATALNF